MFFVIALFVAAVNIGSYVSLNWFPTQFNIPAEYDMEFTIGRVVAAILVILWVPIHIRYLKAKTAESERRTAELQRMHFPATPQRRDKSN